MPNAPAPASSLSPARRGSGESPALRRVGKRTDSGTAAYATNLVRHCQSTTCHTCWSCYILHWLSHRRRPWACISIRTSTHACARNSRPGGGTVRNSLDSGLRKPRTTRGYGRRGADYAKGGEHDFPAWAFGSGARRSVRGDARDEAILETLTGLYNTGELRCAEGRLRISPLFDTDEIRLRGPSALHYSVRFADDRLRDLINQSRVPVSEELVRVLLCLIYHHPDQYPWVIRERPERYREWPGHVPRNPSPEGPR